MTDRISTRSPLVVLAAAILAVAVVGVASPAAAAEDDDDTAVSATSGGTIGGGKDIGVGLGHGLLTSGLTAKFYLQSDSALQFFLGNYGHWYGARCRFCEGVALSGEYVNEFATLAEPDPGRFFIGGGGGSALYSFPDTSGFALNGLFEFGWHFNDFPLELILDFRLGLDFFRSYYGDADTGFLFYDGGAAARFYF